MKAIILCAGEGTRLRPLTYTSAKHLIPIANKPVIFYSIEAIAQAGIRELGIVVSPHREEEFKQTVGDGSRWGIEISYILQPQPKGLAHAVACAHEFVGREPFLVYLGDNLLENGVADFVRAFEREEATASIVLYEVEDPRRFGVAQLQDGQVVRVIEKPAEPPSNLAIVGVYLFDEKIFEAIREIKPSWRNELEITDAIQRLIDKGYRVMPHLVQGWWKDVGKPDDLLQANRLLLERIVTHIDGEVDSRSRVQERVQVAQGAKIINSELRGPVVIGEGALIEDSFIGPFTAIGPRVRIRHSEIEYSILMEGSQIEGIGRIDRSLIGRNVVISKKDRRPEVLSFVLADNSQITLL
ncbi:MAG: glucose-1-phosphate thymidylyltransferase [Candidatus Bipolaricaulota bacterium]|nr:glucose-1-phosphate thymidylyltransferase [Candidatus Bipolaricaulota bacterium]MDW8031748.1 glucose-1-phosphate thymidylyltransferase [Candidatus Bipolaricaulota bacterium]